MTRYLTLAVPATGEEIAHPPEWTPFAVADGFIWLRKAVDVDDAKHPVPPTPPYFSPNWSPETIEVVARRGRKIL